jgi:hypothetical protein
MPQQNKKTKSRFQAFGRQLKLHIRSAIVALALVPALVQTASAQYNYAEGLQKALFFYEVQRSGAKSAESRVEWRGNSQMTDGQEVPWGAIDLTGGWYDAGDTVKWSSTMAFATIHLAWSGLEYPSGYNSTGQMVYLKRNLRWVNDYFQKTFTSTDINNPATYRIITEVVETSGPNYNDHSTWTAAEVRLLVNPMRRVRYADSTAPDTTNVADVAAAIAASSMFFRAQGEATYADELLERARRFFNFADTYRSRKSRLHSGTIDEPSTDLQPIYDDLCQAALWMHKAEKAKNASAANTYLDKAITFEQSQYSHSNYVTPGYGMYSLCNLTLLSQLVPTTGSYRTKAEEAMNFYRNSNKVGGGMSNFNWYDWANLRQVNNAAFTTLVYADTVASGTTQTNFITWAKSQLDYALGSNAYDVSFVGGFVPSGKSEIVKIHHRTAHAGWAGFDYWINDWRRQEVLRHKLYGALVGGPSASGEWPPTGNGGYSVSNANNLEVALDYNSGFTGNLARMVAKGQGTGGVLAIFPPVENRDDEFVSRCGWHNPSYITGPRVLGLEVHIENHTAWPARSTDQLSVRYFFTLDSGVAAGDVTMTNAYSDNTQATITGPTQYSGNTYYFTIRPATNAAMHPTTNVNSRRVFFLKMEHASSAGVIDKSNDWSYPGTTDVNITAKVPVYDNNKRVFGTEPSSLPAVALAVSRGRAQEGTGDTGAFAITRTGDTAAALTVNYAVSGTAVSGTHYTASGSSVTIPAGNRTAGIYITPQSVDADKTVTVTLSTNSAYNITDGSGTVTIADSTSTPLEIRRSPARRSARLVPTTMVATPQTRRRMTTPEASSTGPVPMGSGQASTWAAA